jgi:hypothetical protein
MSFPGQVLAGANAIEDFVPSGIRRALALGLLVWITCSPSSFVSAVIETSERHANAIIDRVIESSSGSRVVPEHGSR